MKADTSYNFPAILSQFCIEGHISKITSYGSGHINGTFFVKNSEESAPDYLLQRINSYVFKDVPALIQNIRLVTTHLRRKLSVIPGANPDREVLILIPTLQNTYFYKDDEDNYWRLYVYVGDTNSYDQIQTSHQAYEGGKAFGKFQFLLADLDSGLLSETIPNFHKIESRLKTFYEVLEKDPVNRAKLCADEISFVREKAGNMHSILNMGKAGQLPLRIIHNDTKFNNILLDKNDRAQCVIDLDTVMPGYVAYDFGDAMRTIANNAAEDEKDLSKITINIPLFEAYTRGYLEETVNFLTDNEINSLLDGVLLLPYMQAVRFLTDFIDGDNYYKINFPDHNLQRTRAQIQLFKKLEENYDTLKNIITEVAKSCKSTKLSGVNS